MSANMSGHILAQRQPVPWKIVNMQLVKLEIRRKLRNKQNLFFSLMFPVLMLLLIGSMLKNVAADGKPMTTGAISAAAITMLSMAAYGALASATSAGAAVAVDRAQGWSRQLRLTPLSPLANVISKTAGGLVMALTSVIAVLITGYLMGIRMPLELWLGGLGASMLGAVIFTMMGLFAGYLFPSENVMQVLGGLLSFLALFGGLFVPLRNLPSIFQTVGSWTPVYGVSQLAHAGLPGYDFNGWALLNLAGWFIVFTVGALLAFQKDTKRV